MTKKLLMYYNALDMSVGDVDIMYECQPELLDLPDTDIVKKLELVIKYGYPSRDIGLLMQVNPSFLLLSEKTLECKLVALGEDVEAKLKENPFLI